MRELIPAIEGALGPERLARLKRDEDAYQDFWEGVLRALERVDWERDALAFLVSAGYGAVRNARRRERTAQRLRFCPVCGKSYGYRTVTCPRCGGENESAPRLSGYLESEARAAPDRDLAIAIEQFVATLSGQEAYVARRWMVERADLLHVNHLKQLAWEMGVSTPRVAQIKKRVREAFASFINR